MREFTRHSVSQRELFVWMFHGTTLAL